jgi:hypothetical protein
MRRAVRAIIVVALAAVMIAALISVEFSDISSRKQITNSHPQQPSGDARKKQDWTAQIAIATDWLDRHKEWINVVSTIFIAGFTGTLWGATKRLWQTSQIHAAHMEGSVRVAQRAAHAAEQSVRTMEGTAERQLRAYVFVDGGSIQLIDENTITLPTNLDIYTGQLFVRVHTPFKNFGSTPAYRFTIWRSVDIWNTNAPQFGEIGTRIGNDIIGPGATIEITADKQITPEEFGEIRNRTKSIFSWGQIDYIDAFNKGRFFRFYHVNGQRRTEGWPLEPAEKPQEAN